MQRRKGLKSGMDGKILDFFFWTHLLLREHEVKKSGFVCFFFVYITIRERKIENMQKKKTKILLLKNNSLYNKNKKNLQILKNI